MSSKPRDGANVTARPMGFNRVATVDHVEFGDMPAAANLSGLLAVKRCQLTGVTRYSINGISVDPDTVRELP